MKLNYLKKDAGAAERRGALFLGVILLATLAGCGGGGGGGGGSAPPATPVAPSGLTYSSPTTVFEGVAMATLVPTLADGSAGTWTVTPPLPAGINLDPGNGEITGTPNAVTALATYTITAENAEGSTTFDLELEVVPVVVPDVNFAAGSSAVLENAPSADVVVELSAATAVDVTVPFTIGGTATAGDDYVTPLLTVVIPAGSTNETIQIALIDDVLVEGVESITLTLGTPTNANTGALDVHTVSIQDDEGTPTVNFESANENIFEDGGTITVNLTLTAAITSPVTATVEVVPSLTTADVSEYSIPSFDVTFAPGQTTAGFAFTVLNDNVFEGDEMVTMNIGSAPGVDIGVIDIVTITIVEDDLAPTAEFVGLLNYSIEEDFSPLAIPVSLSGLSTLDAVLPFTVTGTADASDFAIDSSPLVINAGTLDGMITITPVLDGVPEMPETIIVTLQPATGATIGPNNSVTVTLSDPPSPPTGLEYSTPRAIYGPLVSIQPNMPSSLGSPPTNYTIDPMLPPGLVIDAATGIISGTPADTALQSATTYTITAENALGSTDTTITIQVSAVFVFSADNPIVPYDPSLGDATGSMLINIRELPSGSPLGFSELTGYSVGLSVDSSVVTIDSAVEGPDSLAFNSGQGAAFINLNIDADGVSGGAVFDLFLSQTVVASTPFSIVQLNFTVNPTLLTGNLSGLDIVTPFSDQIGSPAVPNTVVDVASESIPPRYEHPLIQCVP